MNNLPYLLLGGVGLTGCLSQAPEGLAPAAPADVTVKMDFEHRPLPEIPLPNDVATRYDETSATLRRVNASMVAPTALESRVRTLLAELDGWGTLQPISVPFTGPLDVTSIIDAHRDADYDTTDDVVYLINVTPDSPEYGKLHHLDIGNGNYPVALQEVDGYWKNDARGDTVSILFEEVDEDLNGNGALDAGEDSDADGVLDRPNYLPGADPDPDNYTERVDALMTFYERETNTLILKPLVPLLERTTYAVVITRRLLDEDGEPVGSPYPYINHSSQTDALQALPEVLPEGIALEDVAYAFTYTTQSMQSQIQAVRDGIYGHGAQAHLSEQYPAEINGLFELRDPDYFPDMTNPYLIYNEQWLDAFGTLYQEMFSRDPTEREFQVFLEGHRYIDYQVVGWYDAPQLFERDGADGEWLPLDEQSWPSDLDRVPVEPRTERIYFTLTVPRKETSVRGEGKPAPIAIVGHGYGGNRFNGMEVSGFFAKHGLATLSIDNVSHGLSISDTERVLATSLLTGYGLGPYAEATFVDRAFEQNNDTTIDSAADFWTSYLFHTRDVVRQSALDYMQLIRIFRAFDGETGWAFEGTPSDVAGDFDGDGVVDVGGPDGLFTMTGGSLGGMMSMYMGGVEPVLTAIAPLIGGGGLGDLGIRSTQSGVREAFILRPMGPLYVGTLDEKAGGLVLETIVPDLNLDPPELHYATVPGAAVGDTMVVENFANEEVACGYISEEGTVRAQLESDLADPIAVHIYSGDALVLGAGDCSIVEDATLLATVDTFEIEVEFQGETWFAGTPLEAMAEGLGLRRANPELRRFQGLGQLIIDPGDPAAYAKYSLQEPLSFHGPDGTMEETGTHVLQLTSIGDMAVPVAGAMTYARSAGLLEYIETDPTYGVPHNQLLIDKYVAEGITITERYVDSAGGGVLLDIDNFSEGEDYWGDDAPRLDPPLRIGVGETDALGGASAALFMYPRTTGKHGPNSPGWGLDNARDLCAAECETKDCDCDDAVMFDDGLFFYNLSALYLKSGGAELRTDACLATNDCEDFLPMPERRLDPDLEDTETEPWPSWDEILSADE